MTKQFIKKMFELFGLYYLIGPEVQFLKPNKHQYQWLYHKLKDFWEIPQYVNSLGLGYIFFCGISPYTLKKQHCSPIELIIRIHGLNDEY